jgi:hypothetical protein
MLSDDATWTAAKRKASLENGWFIPEFIELAVKNIVENYLDEKKLTAWMSHYDLPGSADESCCNPQLVGIVMAGNIPMVGFHDLISVFLSGHKAVIKPSSKDNVLIRHLADVLISWHPELVEWIRFAETLKDCDAFIATGSNNTSRYFEYYFGKYPHIIRRNKTSVAVLRGNETADELEHLADDVYQFFGLGCRNVTKVYVPEGYEFTALLNACEKYNYLADHHKYKNNYDYNLALHILNNKFYMTNGSIILTEDVSIFSPISQLNYQYYSDRETLLSSIADNEDIQCIVAKDHVAFGRAQSPTLFDYADRVDTMAFLKAL